MLDLRTNRRSGPRTALVATGAVSPAPSTVRAQGENGVALIIGLAIAVAVIIAPLWLSTVAKAQTQPIGGFTAELNNQNVGPQQAKGIVIWSHGYLGTGGDNTANPTQSYVNNWWTHGYDGYRFNRRYILDPAVDVKTLIDSVRLARAAGYKRVILTGQSTGAWEAIMAAAKGVQADGIVAVSPAWHGKVKDQRDISRTKSEWASYVQAVPPGGRYFIVKFLNDDYDVGGALEAAKPAFAQRGIDAVLLNYPARFSGHGAGNKGDFDAAYGPCMFKFIETGMREAPCIGM
jgi:pimeloyl-ACP methyl ester carboxylesterase